MWFFGTLLSGLGWGATVLISISALNCLRMKTGLLSMKEYRNQAIILTLYVLFVFLSSTTAFGLSTALACIVIISPCNESWHLLHKMDPIMNTSLLLIVLTANSFWVWRCRALYRNNRDSLRRVTGILFTIWIATMVTGIYSTCRNWHRLLDTSDALFREMNNIFWSATALLDVIIMVLVATQLLDYRRQVAHYKVLDSPSILISIIAESPALAVVFDVIFLAALNSRHTNVWYLVFPLSSQVMAITQLTIVYRIAQGKAWPLYEKEKAESSVNRSVARSGIVFSSVSGSGGEEQIGFGPDSTT